MSYRVMAGKAIDGLADVLLSNGKANSQGYSILQCNAECTSKPICKSFVYAASITYCELWSKTGPAITNQRADLYIKSTGGVCARTPHGHHPAPPRLRPPRLIILLCIIATPRAWTVLCTPLLPSVT